MCKDNDQNVREIKMTISSIQSVETTPQPLPQAVVADKTVLPSLVEKPFYFSPTLTVDPKTGTAILEIRNSTTGAVITQYPSQKDLQAYAQNSLKPVTDQTDTTGQEATGQEATASADTTAKKTAQPAQPSETEQSTPATTAETVQGQSLIV
jgi:hypothetical protein